VATKKKDRLNVKQALGLLLESVEKGELDPLTCEAEERVHNARVAWERMKVHHSSDSEHWMTPKDFLEKVIQVLGHIELDPAADRLTPEHPERNVPASRHFDGLTPETDALKQPWVAKTVFLNPPYGRVVSKWAEKVVSEYECGNTGAAIVLVSARTDTQWFARFDDYPRCYVRGRLRFSNAEEVAPFPSAVFCLSDDPDILRQFAVVFGDIGMISGMVSKPKKRAA